MSAANGAGAAPVTAPGANLRAGLGGVERTGELRSAELVSRLLAATPPYLYNMPLVPNSYFFSEMLRSFVHAKNNNDANRLSNQNVPPGGHRRSRKRSWNHAKISPTEGTLKPDWTQRSAEMWENRNQDERQSSTYDDKYQEPSLDNNRNYQTNEKPLELTINKNIIPKPLTGFKYPEKLDAEKQNISDIDLQSKMRKSPKVEESSQAKDEKYHSTIIPPPTSTAPTLSLPPPPPPLWYPTMYPNPYGIDPLNFFIDLRVSGHIYDRKHGLKETHNTSQPPIPSETQEPSATAPLRPLGFEISNLSAFKESVKGNRHFSAFSVPKPKDANDKLFPINLCSNGSGKFNMKYYDDIDAKLQETHVGGKNPTSTHYVMQNLKKIYGELANNSVSDEDNNIKRENGKEETEIDHNSDGANDTEASENRKKWGKDSRGRVGFEFAVDCVKTGIRARGENIEEEGSDDGRDSSSDVEVLGEQSNC